MRIDEADMEAYGFRKSGIAYVQRLHGCDLALRQGGASWLFSVGEHPAHAVTDWEELIPMAYQDGENAGKTTIRRNVHRVLGVER